MDNINGLLIWLGVVVFLVLIFVFLVRKYLASLLGFEARASLIYWGMVAVATAGSAFLFLPLTVGIPLPIVGPLVGRGFLIVAGILTFATATVVLMVIVQTRQAMERKKSAYTRVHLFEYKKDLFEKLNQNYNGR